MIRLQEIEAREKTAIWWAVKHRNGWCATKTGMRPAEAATSVPTLCGYFVVLPGGVAQGQTDCEECLAALAPQEEKQRS